MAQIVLIGIGTGLASALLYASPMSGSFVSILLVFLSPLPILIAAIGWSHWAALIAAFTAAAALTIGFSPGVFASYLVRIGLPGWWLGYLALLARPADQSERLEWYPVGHLVIWSALAAVITTTALLCKLGFDIESLNAGLRQWVERFLRALSRTPAGSPPAIPGADSERLIDLLVLMLPPLLAVITTATNLLNLWLAGKVVAISGQLRRPWPDLATMSFPRYAPALLAAAILGTFISGLPGIFSNVAGATLLLAYSALGLAVLHAITRVMPNRALVLSGVYAALIILSWPLLLMALLGLAESAFAIRDRVLSRRGPTTFT